MNEQALIQSLVDDLKPVQPGQFRQQLTLGLAFGGMASLMAMLATIGIQPDLTRSTVFIPLLIKIGYALPLAMLALGTTALLVQPGIPERSQRIAVVALVALLGAVSMMQFAMQPQGQAERLILGASWQSCPWRIAALALPLTAGIGWAVRMQAPVRLRRTGAAVGLAAGSIAAAIYALACTETSAGFVLIWYSLGIALSTGLGAFVGPHLLRW